MANTPDSVLQHRVNKKPMENMDGDDVMRQIDAGDDTSPIIANQDGTFPKTKLERDPNDVLIVSSTKRASKRRCRRCTCCSDCKMCIMSFMFHFQTPLRKIFLAQVTLTFFTVIFPLIGWIFFSLDRSSATYTWEYTFGLVFYSRQFDVNLHMAEESLLDVVLGYLHTYYVYTAIGILIIFVCITTMMTCGYAWLFCIRIKFGYFERKTTAMLAQETLRAQAIYDYNSQNNGKNSTGTNNGGGSGFGTVGSINSD